MCTRYIPPDQAAVERYWKLVPGRVPPWPGQVFPRMAGPFLRLADAAAGVPDAPAGDTADAGLSVADQPATGVGLQLVVGQFGLIPPFATERAFKFATQNARFETIASKPSYRQAWQRGQRCVIPAAAFDEPCWETGRNVWWRFRRTDGAPWGLAGLWNAWTDHQTGEVVESYTMLTINADAHPLMSRMHRPDPALPADQQDKRSVVAIAPEQLAQWLEGTPAQAAQLIRPPAMALFEAGPA